jgi:hypothetical protein
MNKLQTATKLFFPKVYKGSLDHNKSLKRLKDAPELNYIAWLSTNVHVSYYHYYFSITIFLLFWSSKQATLLFFLGVDTSIQPGVGYAHYRKKDFLQPLIYAGYIKNGCRTSVLALQNNSPPVILITGVWSKTSTPFI